MFEVFVIVVNFRHAKSNQHLLSASCKRFIGNVGDGDIGWTWRILPDTILHFLSTSRKGDFWVFSNIHIPHIHDWCKNPNVTGLPI